MHSFVLRRSQFLIFHSNVAGLATPLGWAIAIPQIAGTTVGTMNQNPCVEAMKSRHHTALAIEELKGGLWGKIKRALSNLGGSSETPSDQPQ